MLTVKQKQDAALRMLRQSVETCLRVGCGEERIRGSVGRVLRDAPKSIRRGSYVEGEVAVELTENDGKVE